MFTPPPVDSFDDLPLFATPPPVLQAPAPQVDDSHRAAALAWMEDHPEAMPIFENLALQAARRGRRFGAKALAERVRWEFNITREDDTFKINNSFVSTIARELVRRHPELEPLIEFRTAKGDAA